MLHEPEEFGKFYVGKTVFECKAITDSKGRTLTEEDKENGNG